MCTNHADFVAQADQIWNPATDSGVGLHMRIFVSALVLSGCLAGPAFADEDPGRLQSPHFLVQGNSRVDALSLKDSRVRFSVSGVITRVKLTQVYENHGSHSIEAMYIFPISTGAAVHGMRLRIGDRVIEAQIKEKAAAAKAYAKAKAQGKQAGLLEQHRPNVVQMHVANIRPGDKIEVQVDYTELMSPTEGVYELVIPAVVQPRYTGEATRSEAWTANPHVSGLQSLPLKWHLSGEIHAGLSVTSLRSGTHSISPRFIDTHDVGIEVAEDGADRDFVLHYRLGGKGIETGLMLYPGEEEQFFLLTVAPPLRVAPTQIVAREYVFVVDVSGSMGGFPIATAKKLMQQLVKRLGPQDRFNVVLFAGGSEVMAQQSVAPTAANLTRAENLIAGMRGGGGTNLLSALKRSLKLPRSEHISTSFVVITDGFVSIEREAVELVSNELNTANLFAFGIGRSVNRNLIETLARAGQGEAFVVLSPQQAKPAAKRFRKYIEQPVLTNVQVAFDGFDVLDVEPGNYPDLFASRPVTIFGKYKGQPSGRITITGRNGTGRFVNTTVVQNTQASDDLKALGHLWARHRVRRLSDLDGFGGTAQHTETITQLGLKYGLLTQFTSFVAIANSKVTSMLPGNGALRNLDVFGPSGLGSALSTNMGGLRGVEMGDAGGAGVLGVLGSVGNSAPPAFKARGASVNGLGSTGTGRGRGGIGYGKMILKPGQVKSSGPVMGGPLDRNIIQQVIRQHRRRLQRAYENTLKSKPGLSGKVVFELRINAQGRVIHAKLTSDTLNDPMLAKALLRILRGLKFPKPKGGGTVIIKYPLIFRPG